MNRTAQHYSEAAKLRRAALAAKSNPALRRSLVRSAESHERMAKLSAKIVAGGGFRGR